MEFALSPGAPRLSPPSPTTAYQMVSSPAPLTSTYPRITHKNEEPQRMADQHRVAVAQQCARAAAIVATVYQALSAHWASATLP